MAFTTTDLAAIDAAIASGELTIRAADGKMVTLRTMAELLQARDAGYKDYADVVAQLGDDAEAHQIDVDALCDSVTQATGHDVFQDSYGNGVALVDGKSYATHKDLADSIGRHIAEFFA